MEFIDSGFASPRIRWALYLVAYPPYSPFKVIFPRVGYCKTLFAEINSGKPCPLVIVVVALQGNKHFGFLTLNRTNEKLNTDDFID